MIRYVKGNLLSDNAQALVNTVNTVGVMGKGIALQFREAFPNNYKTYRKVCQNGELHVGEMLVTEEPCLDGTKLIINFPTKTDWRKPSEYSYISTGLQALRREIVDRGIRSIAIPSLGSNNGGLDWNKVRAMMAEALADVDCDIRIYEPSRQIVERLKKERVRLTPARAMLLDMMHEMTKNNEFASVFAAEKLVYFLQRFGAGKTFNITFEKGFYGPYSKGKIAHVLYHLNGSYVKGMTGMQSKPFDIIWLVEDTYDDIRSFLDNPEYKTCRQILAKTKNFLRGYYSSFSLELLSSVDYLINEDDHFAEWQSMSQDELILLIADRLSHWSTRKAERFSHKNYIGIALRHLQESQLLPFSTNSEVAEPS